MFSIMHHGAVDGVTGSCHELRLDTGDAVLIDCGMFQGAETSPDGARSNQLQIDFPVAHVRSLIVTHVHIDHVGRIPFLLAAKFRGPIYCSPPSAVLLPLVLEDAVQVGVTRDRRLVERFLEQLRRQIVAVSYGEWQRIDVTGAVPLQVRFQPAGHILGSAFVECRVGQGRNSQMVVFSGDLGAPHTPLLPAPKSPRRADVLVIESTYGDRLHQGRKIRRGVLQRVIEGALENRGAVIIPAFSIGRTQELLYEIEDIIFQATRKGGETAALWGELGIIVDSPLANSFTTAFRKLKSYWDAEARQRDTHGRHPLSFRQLITVDSHPDHLKIVKHLAATANPAIIIAASGMCAGGRVVNYLKAMIEDPRHDILFVGYQARGTPGRAIQDFGQQHGYVLFDDVRYTIRARIHTVSGYSAHADQKDLIRFVTGMGRPPREIRVIHGDDIAKVTLQKELRRRLPDTTVIIPTN